MKYLLMLLLLTSCTFNIPGTGAKTGRIVRISNQGIIWKTCEIELIRGGLNDGSGSFGASTFFTIEDSQNMEIATQAMQENCEVTVYYRCELFSSATRSQFSSPNFVTNIEKKEEL